MKITNHSQRKKDEDLLLGNHLETRNNNGGRTKITGMPIAMDNHADISQSETKEKN